MNFAGHTNLTDQAIPYFPSKLSDRERELRRVQLLVNLRFWFPRVKLIKALKRGRFSSVYLATRGGEKIIVKKFWPVKDPGSQVRATAKALRRFQILQSESPDQQFGVNQYLGGSSRLGLVLLSYEKGRCVRTLLRDGCRGRLHILDMCARWEYWSSQAGRQTKTFSVESRVSYLESYFERHPEMLHRPLAIELRDALLIAVKHLEGQDCTWSYGHGDHAPRNLIWRANGEMRGVDIHMDPALPVARRAARFLVSKDMWTDPEGENTRFGLNKREMDRYLQHDTVPLNERGTFLIYFIGLMFLEQQGKGGSQQVEICRQRGLSYLCDLKRSLAKPA